MLAVQTRPRGPGPMMPGSCLMLRDIKSHCAEVNWMTVPSLARPGPGLDVEMDFEDTLKSNASMASGAEEGSCQVRKGRLARRESFHADRLCMRFSFELPPVQGRTPPATAGCVHCCFNSFVGDLFRFSDVRRAMFAPVSVVHQTAAVEPDSC